MLLNKTNSSQIPSSTTMVISLGVPFSYLHSNLIFGVKIMDKATTYTELCNMAKEHVCQLYDIESEEVKAKVKRFIGVNVTLNSDLEYLYNERDQLVIEKTNLEKQIKTLRTDRDICISDHVKLFIRQSTNNQCYTSYKSVKAAFDFAIKSVTEKLTTIETLIKNNEVVCIDDEDINELELATDISKQLINNTLENLHEWIKTHINWVLQHTDEKCIQYSDINYMYNNNDDSIRRGFKKITITFPDIVNTSTKSNTIETYIEVNTDIIN